jgi:hypothetical protein
MKMVKATQTRTQPNNSVIAFHDNSSAIQGTTVPVCVESTSLWPLGPGSGHGQAHRPHAALGQALYPKAPGEPSPFECREGVNRHLILTAETHNFPTGVAPFEGAATVRSLRVGDRGRGTCSCRPPKVAATQRRLRCRAPVVASVTCKPPAEAPTLWQGPWGTALGTCRFLATLFPGKTRCGDHRPGDNSRCVPSRSALCALR